MTAAAPALAVVGARSADRRLPVAFAAAAVLHGALLWQSRMPSGGERILAPAPAISVRIVNSTTTVVETASQPVVGSVGPSTAPEPALDAAGRAPDSPLADRAMPAVATAAAPAVRPVEPATSAPDTAAASPAVAAPPASTGLPDAPAYLLSARLDPGPQPLEDILPEYPDGAELRSGAVILRLLISESGRVDDVAVVQAQPPGVFEKAALAAFRSARFAPGRFLGTPVKSQITIEVAFTPLDRGPRVSGRGY